MAGWSIGACAAFTCPPGAHEPSPSSLRSIRSRRSGVTPCRRSEAFASEDGRRPRAGEVLVLLFPAGEGRSALLAPSGHAATGSDYCASRSSFFSYQTHCAAPLSLGADGPLCRPPPWGKSGGMEGLANERKHPTGTQLFGSAGAADLCGLSCRLKQRLSARAVDQRRSGRRGHQV